MRIPTALVYRMSTVRQKEVSKMSVAFLWCLFLIQTTLTDTADGLHSWWKQNPEMHAVLRRQPTHHKVFVTPTAGVLSRRTGERRPVVSPVFPPSPLPRELDAQYLNSLLKSAKSTELLPYVRRSLPSTNVWSALYSSENVHTSVRLSSPSSNMQMPVERSRSHDLKTATAPPLSLVQSDNDLSSREHHTDENRQISAKEFYKNMYATEDGVTYLKTTYGPTNLTQAKVSNGVDQELEDVRLANEHFLRMRNTIRCRIPVPEVVCVKDVYVNAEKEYLPRCTLLHRCGDRSGCCDSDEFKCVPRAVQEVALNFYTVHTDFPPGETPPENSVEKLLFDNHTECECVSVDDHLRPPPLRDQQAVQTTANPLDHEPTPAPNTESPNYHSQQRDDHVDRKPKAGKKYQKCGECPVPFHHREYEDGRCSCDCFDKERPCIRIKRGRDALSEPERRCIESGRCHIPDCEYGLYVSSAGRCPKRPEDYEKHVKNGRHKNLQNHHHRWTFFERD